MTIVLHDGGEQIGFNWGTLRDRAQSHTQEYEIQLGIATMMKRVGGFNNELSMKPFQVGTMT